MSEFSPSQLLTALDAVLRTHAAPRFCIALSGGLDSMALLHAMAELRSGHSSWQLRAIHVDHQLQTQSVAWSQRCVVWAAELGIDCGVLRVQVIDVKNQGMEAAARKARYAALQAELTDDEVLLTAHHADDQLETILLAMMRGAGVDGLAAMPGYARFAHAWHARPLLGVARDELQAWAHSKQLPFITDPSNTNTQYDRNFLRHSVVPLLKQRWPAAALTGSRSTSHLGEAQALLNEWVAQDYAHAAVANTLRVDVLRQLSGPRRRALVRYWLQQHAVQMPSTRVLHSLEHDMLQAADDRVPCVRWQDYALHRYRDHLYLEKNMQWDTVAKRVAQSIEWRWREELHLPDTLGVLRMTTMSNASATTAQRSSISSVGINTERLMDTLTIQFRQGGERIRLPGELHHRELKKLLQDAEVLPWWRGRVPLLFQREQLVAVADLWVSAEFAGVDLPTTVRLNWLGRPNISRHDST